MSARANPALAAPGYGRRPLRDPWRRGAVLLWSSFLGAACSVAVLVLLPEGWFDTPISNARLAVAFTFAWLLALIPAIATAALLGARRAPDAR